MKPLPSETPTERLTHCDLIEEARERGDLRRYFEAVRADTERLKNWRCALWLETLREIVDY